MIILLDLMGGVALLLWGLHMVNTGVIRAFGADFRRILGAALRNRWRAFLAGVGITAVLQSGTATALLTSTLAARGMVELAPALAIMLGANVGTSLVVQVLSLNISVLAPLLLVVGVVAFKRGQRTMTRDLGRVAIGLGLMLVSLHILLDTLAPAENALAVRASIAMVTDQPLLSVLMGAVLSWAAHSSVAAVSLVMSLAYSSFVTPAAALALVLGANLGAAVNPVLEGTQAGNPASRRLPLGNPLARRLPGVHRDEFTPPRCPPGPEAHPFPHLRDGLSGAGGGGRALPQPPQGRAGRRPLSRLMQGRARQKTQLFARFEAVEAFAQILGAVDLAAREHDLRVAMLRFDHDVVDGGRLIRGAQVFGREHDTVDQ